MTTIAEQIADKIDERLANITTANGYSFDLKKKERARLTPFKNGDLPALNFWTGTTRKSGAGAGFIERDLDMVIECHTTTRDRPFTDVSYELAADIEIALDRDTLAPQVTDTPSMSLGGMVQSLSIDTITPSIGEGQAPWCGVAISLTVAYKMKKSDPFTIIN